MAVTAISQDEARELITSGREHMALGHLKAMEAQIQLTQGMAILSKLSRGLLGEEPPEFEPRPMPVWSG